MKSFSWILFALFLLLALGAILLYSTKQNVAKIPVVEAEKTKEQPAHPFVLEGSVLSSPPNGSAPLAQQPSRGATEESQNQGTAPTFPKDRDPLQGKRLSVEEFRSLGQEVARSLPSKSDLQKLSSKLVHETPTPLIYAGERLGLIAQAVHNEPSLAVEAVHFYQACASSLNFPDSVRALCFSNYRLFSKSAGRAVDASVVSKSIRDLAEKLEGL